MNEGMHLEKYGLGESDPINPLIPLIEEMFSNELHEHSWKKYTVEKTTELLKSKMKEKGISFTDRHYVLLKRKISKCKNMVDCLTILTEAAYGKIEQG